MTNAALLCCNFICIIPALPYFLKNEVHKIGIAVQNFQRIFVNIQGVGCTLNLLFNRHDMLLLNC